MQTLTPQYLLKGNKKPFYCEKVIRKCSAPKEQKSFLLSLVLSHSDEFFNPVNDFINAFF